MVQRQFESTGLVRCGLLFVMVVMVVEQNAAICTSYRVVYRVPQVFAQRCAMISMQ